MEFKHCDTKIKKKRVTRWKGLEALKMWWNFSSFARRFLLSPLHLAHWHGLFPLENFHFNLPSIANSAITFSLSCHHHNETRMSRQGGDERDFLIKKKVTISRCRSWVTHRSAPGSQEKSRKKVKVFHAQSTRQSEKFETSKNERIIKTFHDNVNRNIMVRQRQMSRVVSTT